MLKARSGNLILLGLDRENIKRLQEGKPIKFDGADVGLPGVNIGILYGETLLHIQRDLQKAGFVLPDAPTPAPERRIVREGRDFDVGFIDGARPECNEGPRDPEPGNMGPM